MAQTLMTNTPLPAHLKRPLSRDGQVTDRPGSTGPVIPPNDGAEDDPSSPRVRIPAYLTKTKNEIAEGFQELEWRQRFRLQHALHNPTTSPFRVDRSEVVISRNRYGNVQPWHASRVKLKDPLGGSDYVNASPISLKSCSAPSSPRSSESPSASMNLDESKYIATQGPKDGQFSHFWNMVMQETAGDVGVIVMLTQCFEGLKEKCSQYFPLDMDKPTVLLPMSEEDDDGVSQIGDPFLDPEPEGPAADTKSTDDSIVNIDASDIVAEGRVQTSFGTVTLIDVQADARTKCEVRYMRLDIGGQRKDIYHYLFKGWPDFGKPEADDKKALVELVKESARRAGGPTNPRFVHCSAGVGRTGTFIALDHLLQELAHGRLGFTVSPLETAAYLSGHSQSPDNGDHSSIATKTKENAPDLGEDLIFDTVNKLREQRMMMVVNEIQYLFLYEVVREAFMEKYSSNMNRSQDKGNDESSPKVAKKSEVPFPNVQDGTKVEKSPTVDEDIVSEERVEGAMKDPYAAVTPENSMQ